MKKLMIALVAASMILAGCSKEKMAEPVSSSDNDNHGMIKANDATFVELTLTTRGVDQNSLEIPLSDFKSKHQTASTSDLPFLGVSKIGALELASISGAEVQAVRNGVESYVRIHACGSWIDLVLSSTCEQDNEHGTVFIGQITWVNNDGGFPKFFGLGKHLIYKSEKSSTGSEHFSNNIYIFEDTEDEFPICSVDLLDILPWPVIPMTASSDFELE